MEAIKITTAPDFPFVVDNDSKAEWAAKKIREARQDTKTWTEYYEKQLSAIRRANEDTEAYFSALLADYFETVPHKATKTQESYGLPTCKLVLKAQQPEFNRDEMVLCDYLDKKGRDDLVKITRRADWAALKKMLKVMEDGTCVDADGEIVEGVQAFNRPPEFKIEMKEGTENE
jgi:hypothetical protein